MRQRRNKKQLNRKSPAVFFAILSLATLLTATMTSCGKEKAGDRIVPIYDVNREWTRIVPSKLELDEEIEDLTSGELVGICLNRMIAGSKDPDVVGAIGKDVGDITYRLEGSVVTIDFSQKYYNSLITQRVLRRAAVVKTLCRIDGITGVAFTVNGNPIMDSNGQTVGVMTEDSFVESDGAKINAYERTELHLYFANEDGDKLLEEVDDVVYSSNISMERLVVDQLLLGPKSDSRYPVINPECKVMNVTTKDGICYVNLSAPFLTKTTNVSDEVTVYAIVNSLTALSGINKVQIMIDGETEVSYGKLYLSLPFEAKYSLCE